MVAEYGLNNGKTAMLNPSGIVTAIQENARWIAGFTLAAIAVAGAYSYGFYPETYQSSAMVLLNPVESSNAETAERRKSDYKNQEALLTSQALSNRIFSTLKKQKINLPVGHASELPEQVLNAAPIPETQLIRLSAKAKSPALAKKLATVYVDQYVALVQELSANPVHQRKALFEKRVVQTEAELERLNHKIKDYQDRYGILDLTVESQNQVHQLLTLESQLKSVQAELAQKQGEVARLRKQLNIKAGGLEAALRAVANGQDTVLTELQEQLNDAHTDYSTKALIYAPTNPDMVQLQKRIDVLSRQIADRQIVTVGQTSKAGQDTANYDAPGLIKDSVRTALVNRLVAADAEVSALQGKLRAVRSQQAQLQGRLKNMSQHQLDYAHLEEEMHGKEAILIRLRQNLSDLQIQETALQKQLTVIDQPALPIRPVAPQHWQMMLLAALLGGGFSALAIAGSAFIKPKNVCPDFVETTLNLPVMAMIPWTADAVWKGYRKRNRLEVLATDVNQHTLKAYQNLALNLRVQRNATQQNLLVVSSLLKNAGRSIMLSNLAVCLAQSGDRVLLIDANLRSPSLHECFNHSLDYENGLPELVNSVSELLYRKPDTQVADVLQLVEAVATASDVHPQLRYLNAGLMMANTFEFLNTKSFDVLMNVLKAGYDWVLLDAPPFLSQPDGAVLLGYADGLLLFVERDAEQAQLLSAHKKIERLNSHIAGVVLREPKTSR